VRVLGPSNEEAMVWLFLRGELDSERYGSRIRGVIDERLLLEPDLDDVRQNALRRAALTTVRGYESREGLFHGFPDDVRWTWAELSPEEVLEVRYIEYDYWVELSAGSRRPSDAAEQIRAGVDVFRVPSAEFLADVGADAPPLIVVGDGSRLVVLEGHTRLTRYALRPDVLPPALKVRLGRSSRIAEWACW
jgi:hypothetical protein